MRLGEHHKNEIGTCGMMWPTNCNSNKKWPAQSGHTSCHAGSGREKTDSGHPGEDVDHRVDPVVFFEQIVGRKICSQLFIIFMEQQNFQPDPTVRACWDFRIEAKSSVFPWHGSTCLTHEALGRPSGFHQLGDHIDVLEVVLGAREEDVPVEPSEHSKSRAKFSNLLVAKNMPRNDTVVWLYV